VHHLVGVGDADRGQDEHAVDDGLPHHPPSVKRVHGVPAATDAHTGRPSVPASMKVFSRWIEEMPMIAIASFTFSTEALTWLSHAGWSGWPSRRRRETKVS